MYIHKVSMYLCYLLRHHPESLPGLHMDGHGWVSCQELIDAVNKAGIYQLSFELLQTIVSTDAKGRYRMNEDETRIKACQGHSIPWVEPELMEQAPPNILYHGTTTEAYKLICKDGFISRMERHAVHMHADKKQSWKSACRWKKNPVILVLDAGQMYQDGHVFSVSENGIWCTEQVPAAYIVEVLYELPKDSPSGNTGAD